MAEHSGLANVRSTDVNIVDDVLVTDDINVTGLVTVTETLAVSGIASLNGGAVLGNATTDTVGFYGVTAVNQPASANQAIYTLTALTDVTGDDTTSQQARMNQVIDDLAGMTVLLEELRGQLVSVGIIKGAA